MITKLKKTDLLTQRSVSRSTPIEPTVRRGIALTITMFVVLSGCVGNPVDIKEMSEALSAELGATAAEMAEPIMVSDGYSAAISRAVQANAGYRFALSQKQEAASIIGVAESVRRPQVNLSANLGTWREFKSSGDSFGGLSGNISLSQLIFDGGESTAAINRATAEALAAEALSVSQENMLALEAGQAWIDVWQYDQRMKLLRSRASELEVMLQQMERMATNGFVDRAALDSSRRHIVDVRLEETRLIAGMADARVRFRRLFRNKPGRLSEPEEIVTPTLARSLVGSWKYAPSLEALAAKLIAARHGVVEAEAAFRPRLRLQTGVRTPMNVVDPSSGTLGISFDFNPFDGKRRVHQLEVAVARRAAAEAQFEEESGRLEAELASALEQLKGIERSMPLVAEQIRLSRSEAEAARSQITTGQSTLRQLVEAEVQNYRASDRQIEMRAERHSLLLNIAAQAGQLGRLIGLPKKPDSAILIQQD